VGPYRRWSGEQRERVGAWLLQEFRAGRLRRPTECAACRQRVGIIDAHNEDYDKPEEFVGLCLRCHLMLHCRFKNRVAWERYRAELRRGFTFPPLFSRSFGPIAKLLNDLSSQQVSLSSGPGFGPSAIGPTWLDSITD
jgi:hypothetical protein